MAHGRLMAGCAPSAGFGLANRRSLIPTVVLALASAWPISAQVQSSELRVRVSDANGVPVRRALIVIGDGAVTRDAVVDSTGVAVVRIASRDSVAIAVSAIGMRSAGRMVRLLDLARPWTVSFVLAPSSFQLNVVRVTARDTSLTELSDRRTHRNGARDEYLPALAGWPHGGGDDGSLINMLTALPGFDRSGAGFSVLGLAGEQNQVFLNGLPLPALQLPRDVTLLASASSTPSDASLGGFAGGSLDLGLVGGTNYRSLVVRAGGSAPWTTVPLADGLSSSRVHANVAASFPLVLDRVYALISAQISHESRDDWWLNSAPARGLAKGVLAPAQRDSAISALSDAGVEFPQGVTSQGNRLNMLSQVDFDRLAGGALSSTLVINAGDLSGIGASPLALSSRSTSSSSSQFAAQTRWRRLLHEGMTWQNSLALTGTAAHASAGRAEPAGILVIADPLQADSLGATSVAFGGANVPATIDVTNGLTARTQLEFRPWSPRHRVTLMGEWAERGAARDRDATLAGGVFYYPDATALRSGRPALYERASSLLHQRATLKAWSSAWSGTFRFSGRREVSYGLRAEYQTLASPNALDSAVQVLAPTVARSFAAFDVSPRVGLTIDYGPRENPFRGRIALSAGRFVGALPVEGALSSFGDARSNLTRCIGSDIAMYTWGTGAPAGGCTAPGTTSVTAGLAGAAGLAPASSWRGSVSWREVLFHGRLWPQLDVTWSATDRLPTRDDVNLAAVGAFTLPDEGGRPVFVPRSAVDMRTGSMSLSGARRMAGLGQVVLLDARGASRSLQAVASVIMPELWDYQLRLSYTATVARDLITGLAEGRTSGGQGGLWVPSAFAPEHSVRAAITGSLPGGVLLTAFGEWASGLPFTPLVDRDVNGDGYSNDAAFIPALGPASASALGRRLAARLSSLPSGVRQCLMRQQETVAAPRSCVGPSRSQLDARLELDAGWLRLPHPATIQLDLLNLPAMADLLLNGRSGLQGWGQQRSVDPVLLQVRGFDSAAARFRYGINESFGSWERSAGASALAPFAIRLEVRVNFSKPYAVQAARLARARASDAARTKTIDDLQRRWPDPFAMLESRLDSADVTREDLDRLLPARRAYWSELNQAWRRAAIVALDSTIAEPARVEAIRVARARSDSAYEDATRRIRELLGEVRYQRLPEWTQFFLRPGAIRAVRSRLD